MDRLAQDFVRYMKETVNIRVHPEMWDGEGGLPVFLRDLYDFFQVSILGTYCLVMVPKPGAQPTPALIRKHILQVEKQWEDEVIYASRDVSAYNRKRLIEQKVSFVIPWNQMYLVPLGIDLREHFKKPREEKAIWRPSTQAAFLSAILQGPLQGLTPKELADRLGYTPMSMTRAYNELEMADLGQVNMEGRLRILRLNTDRYMLWEKALQFLQSPVKRHMWVKFSSSECSGVKSGLSALAEYSALSSPSNPVVALDTKEWKQLHHHNRVTVLPVQEPEACLLEIWSYSPRLFAEGGIVDRFSLYLSLRATDDERVAAALDEMMEKVVW